MARRKDFTTRERQLALGAMMRSAKKVYRAGGPHADADGQYDWRPAWSSVQRALAEDADGFAISTETLKRQWAQRDPQHDEALRIMAGLEDVKDQAAGGALWSTQARGHIRQRLDEMLGDSQGWAEARIDHKARALQLSSELIDRLSGEEDMSGLTDEQKEQRALIAQILGD